MSRHDRNTRRSTRRPQRSKIVRYISEHEARTFRAVMDARAEEIR